MQQHRADRIRKTNNATEKRTEDFKIYSSLKKGGKGTQMTNKKHEKGASG